MAEKKIKTKTCAHQVTYYDSSVKDFICQYCKKVIGELRMGKSKLSKQKDVKQKRNNSI